MPAATLAITSAALVHDQNGRVLIVRAARSRRWQLPGGLVEPGESPRQAARREVREELGLHVHPGALLAADWIPPRTPGRPRLALLFTTSPLPPDALQEVQLQVEEIDGWHLVTIQQARRLLHPLVAERLPTTPDRPRTPLYRELPNAIPH
ncbi:NUDIX hydrolase [Streptomyces sp. DSM 44915]|uniref:NUDIX hydrolase n=1 Tax=Streptomyces chisholmiae TaxID=3075540 RepID=A0ABU2JZ08_9ACTN|nr:NUDIX hydrolase [Streptomyces sp. DSM 44915]MDT0270236.1 NUDIX hydrolase [Streptomyces sp. DSM 44915]